MSQLPSWLSHHYHPDHGSPKASSPQGCHACKLTQPTHPNHKSVPPLTHRPSHAPVCESGDEAPRPDLTWPDAPAAPRAARSGLRGSGVSAPHSRSTGTSSAARARARSAPPERRGWPCGRPLPAAERVPAGTPTSHPRALPALPASPTPGRPRPLPASGRTWGRSRSKAAFSCRWCLRL